MQAPVRKPEGDILDQLDDLREIVPITYVDVVDKAASCIRHLRQVVGIVNREQ